MWQHVADPQRDQFERLVQKARDLLAEGVTPSGDRGRAPLSDRLAACEARLHEALALSPFDFSTLFLLFEVQSLRGHAADAVATLERAEPLARLPGQKATCWFRLGLERSHLGRYREALASYDQQIALGETEAPAYANAAELLMGARPLARGRGSLPRGDPHRRARRRSARPRAGPGVQLLRPRRRAGSRSPGRRRARGDRARDRDGPQRIAAAPGPAARRRLLVPARGRRLLLHRPRERDRRQDRRRGGGVPGVHRAPAEKSLDCTSPSPPRFSDPRPVPVAVLVARPRPRRRPPPPLARRRRRHRLLPGPARRAGDRRRAQAAPAALGRVLRRRRAVARSRHRALRRRGRARRARRRDARDRAPAAAVRRRRHRSLRRGRAARRA